MSTIPSVILAFDTSSAACTAALFDASGVCVASRDEIIGRGHSERLVPMIAELVGDVKPDEILVGVGPGSFTGIRVAIAAAHGMAIGWNCRIRGMSSLALLAAAAGTEKDVAAAVTGGHGEVFVQSFSALQPTSDLLNLRPSDAAEVVSTELVAGSAAGQLVAARGWGQPTEAWPSASNALILPPHLRDLPPKPVYARAPDAKVAA